MTNQVELHVTWLHDLAAWSTRNPPPSRFNRSYGTNMKTVIPHERWKVFESMLIMPKKFLQSYNIFHVRGNLFGLLYWRIKFNLMFYMMISVTAWLGCVIHFVFFHCSYDTDMTNIISQERYLASCISCGTLHNLMGFKISAPQIPDDLTTENRWADFHSQTFEKSFFFKTL